MAARETKWHRGVEDVEEERATPPCKKILPSICAGRRQAHATCNDCTLEQDAARTVANTMIVPGTQSHKRTLECGTFTVLFLLKHHTSCTHVHAHTQTHAHTYTQGIKTRGAEGANAMALFRLVPRCTCHRALVIKASSATRPSQHCCLCPILVPHSVIARKLLTSRH